MKVIIAGSRGITDKYSIYSIIYEFHERYPITEVVCGMADGVDSIGGEWANLNDIKVTEFPADWVKYGLKVAGHKRNERMAKYADALLLIWDGHSTGSKDMLNRAKKLNLLIDLRDQSQLRLF